MENIILESKSIDQRITRIAYEIYEDNIDESFLLFAGIANNGRIFAQLVAEEFNKISSISTKVVELDVDKSNPSKDEIHVDSFVQDNTLKSVIIFDDVLNSGKTAAYTLKAFLNINLEKIALAVMVNRSHSSFPIYSKFTGYELATTISEHVEVVFNGSKKGVYLS